MILFCAATGIDRAAVGILAHAMQSMVIRGFIAHNRESGAYTLTDSGRATLGAKATSVGGNGVSAGSPRRLRSSPPNDPPLISGQPTGGTP